jgi:hypothetical protein
MRCGRMAVSMRCLAAAVLMVAGRAMADGCYFMVVREELGQSKALVSSHKQEAILATDSRLVQVVLRTHFTAGPSDMAWFIPVPGAPDHIEKVDPTIFDRLDSLMAPTFEKITHHGGPGLSCGCASNVSAESHPVVSTVHVEQVGTAGIFNFHTLNAEKADDLVQWLTDNGYNVPPGAAEVFQRYIGQHWHWLVVRVRPEEAKKGTLAPHPISYTYEMDTLTYESGKLVFPLVISSLSAAEQTELVLYVVGQSCFKPVNWRSCTLDTFGKSLQQRKASPSGTNYEDLLRERTYWSDGHLLVTEYAMSGGGVGYHAGDYQQFNSVLREDLIECFKSHEWLMRIRGYILREKMDRDILLEIDPSMPYVPPRLKLFSSSAGRGGPALASSGLPGVLAGISALTASMFFRSRRRSLRVLRVLMVGVAVAVFIAI